jgi:hypothetical protein
MTKTLKCSFFRKSYMFVILNFGHCDLFGICDLVFEFFLIAET